MRRKAVYILSLLLMTCLINSCEVLGNCKICRQVTYIDGKVDYEGPEAEYCDAELIAIEAKPDIINGNTRLSWECR
ncbi:MAG: hypothetical protein HPY62_00435 [Bacteroidales bacterium]|nr:hypothetical protein [Bacteroidales bacterium]